MPLHQENGFRWLRTGDAAFAAMFSALETARQSIRLEMYIFAEGELGNRFREALVAACQRKVRVQVLIDAWGSVELSDDYWQPVIEAGGSFYSFNPLDLGRIAFRDHRKLLLCDDQVAFIGGFNIAPEYEGDGVNQGWLDLGLELRGPLVEELAESFDEMVRRADFKHKRFMRLRKFPAQRTVSVDADRLLLGGPGRGASPILRALREDLAKARRVQIIAAYFLPNWKIRRALTRIARHGGQVQLIVPAKSDVFLSQLATRSLYQRLLRAGVEIYEYEPQILHAKLTLIDEVVYVGSANLDMRSLHINYELLARLGDARVLAEARDIFAETLRHCRRIEPQAWRRSRTFWSKLKEQWAYLLLARWDILLAQRQLRTLR
jgi:cardiolipin synthase